MSRNASGTYSLPTGNPVTTNTTISSTWANSTLTDIGTEITDSLSRSGEGGMLAGLPAFAGTVSLPSYTFTGDLNTGLYWVSADSFAVSCGAAVKMTFAAAAITVATGVNLTVANAATGAEPATPTTGALVYDTSTNKLKVWTGAAWTAVH